MEKYCGIFKMVISKILYFLGLKIFFIGSKFALKALGKSSHKILDMTEKGKTVIESYFLLPYF